MKEGIKRRSMTFLNIYFFSWKLEIANTLKKNLRNIKNEFEIMK